LKPAKFPSYFVDHVKGSLGVSLRSFRGTWW